MKRRRVGFGLAAVAVVALFVAAKSVASWRPKKLGEFAVSAVTGLRASPTRIYDSGGKGWYFDLPSGKSGPRGTRTGFIAGGAWNWELQRAQSLVLHENLREATPWFYAIPESSTFSKRQRANFGGAVEVRMDDDRVKLLVGALFYRWDRQSGRLMGQLEMPDAPTSAIALARDGETVIKVNGNYVTTLSTRTGRVMSRVNLQKARASLSIQISAYGAYTFYDDAWPGAVAGRWFVVDTRTGRVTAEVNLGSYPGQIAFSPDETEIAVPIVGRDIWEVRALKTGALLRTLPLVPGAQGAAFSPDGATLYSVANGVLYRQRAR